jgi:hypothetical protein
MTLTPAFKLWWKQRVLISPYPDLLPFKLFCQSREQVVFRRPDPENRVGDQDTGSSGGPVSSVLQVPSELFPS